MKKTIVLGVDVGGSHITTALVDIDKGVILRDTAARESLNSMGTVEKILDTWVSCIRQSLSVAATSGVSIGIAMPGPFEYENGISRISQQPKFRSLYGLPLKHLLGGMLGLSEERIYFMNDACSFLKGEMLGGALRGQDHVMGITLGTGLGSAFSRNGEVVDADLWQSPFADGIAEDYLSTRWFTGRYQQLSGQSIAGVKELADLPDQDPLKQQVFMEFAENLASFILQQQEAHQYENIVIGGNIAKAAPYFIKELDKKLKARAGEPVYCLAELGEAAPLIGAAGMAYVSVMGRRLV